ncbi:MAG: dihydropyrimidinase [Acidobacteria bacterium]|nr:MAG: dihydropyrimidinase [Acidobacteriota bacterium]
MIEKMEGVMKRLIQNGTIVTSEGSFQGDVYIENGRIHSIGTGLSARFPGAELVDATGKLVLPGAIDGHTHIDMPLGDIHSSDSYLTGTRAALFGGTTTVVDYANQVKGESLEKTLKDWQNRAKGLTVCDYGFHMTVSDPKEQFLDEIPALLEAGVSSFKCFFAYKGRLMIDNDTFVQLMKLSRKHHFLVNLHAENGDMVEDATLRLLSEGKTGPQFHPQAHPREAEVEAVARAIRLAKDTGGNLNLVHITCKESVELIAEGKMRGVSLFAETCPQYLVLTDEKYKQPGFEAAKWVLSPPLRKLDDQNALWAGLANGTLDTVGTDHCPFFFESQKTLGKERFDRIPNGAPGIEDRLELLYHFGVKQNRLSLTEWVDRCCTAPAKRYGMYPKKGDIVPGANADLVIFDTEKHHTITAESRHMNVDYNACEGMSITGKVEQVFLRGIPVIRDNACLAEPGSGQYLLRFAAEGC